MSTAATSTGIFEMSAEEYHADPAERLSLSASIAAVLCSASPAHARAAHPRLNPDFKRKEKAHYDVGSAAHAILLEGEAAIDRIVVVDAENWLTKAAKEAREQAYIEGQIPLLAHVLADVQAMVAAAHEQLAAHVAKPPLFTDGLPEQTLIWEEAGGVFCRARIDWLRDDRTAICDLKTTSRSAHPEAYSRALFGVGGDIQAAFYVRGVQMLTGAVPEFRWAVIENTPPFALSVISPGPDVLTIGHKKIEWALERWRECLKRDEWEGYPREVCYAQLPTYEETRWLDRVARDEEVAA